MPIQDQTAYFSSVGYAAVAQWVASHAYTVGQLARQLAAPTVGQERVFICSAAGTSGSSEPAWGLIRSSKTTDGGVFWYPVDGMPALNGDLVNCASWTASNSYTLAGVVIRNSASTYLFIITATGNSGSTEPTWNTATGATTTDGASLVWTCIGPVSNFPGWTAPCARLSRVADAGINPVAGQTFYVADNHAETAATLNSIQANQTLASLLCIDHTVALPATGAAALKTTASVTNTGSSVSISSFEYVYGVQFIQAAASVLQVSAGSNNRCRFDHCLFNMTVGTTNYIELMAQSNAGSIECINCSFNLNAVGQSIQLATTVVLRNCSFTGTAPTVLFGASQGMNFPVLLEGCDLSLVTNQLFLATSAQTDGQVTVKDCKLAGGVTVVASPTLIGYSGRVDLNRCDSGGTAYRNERWTAFASETTAINVVRTGGASDGATLVSHRIATAAINIKWIDVHPAIPLAIWNSLVGSNRNVTLYGVVNDSRVPNNDEAWFDVEYLGSASSPLGLFVSGTKSNILATGTALTADTSAWDSAATARANTHAYLVGDVIKTASNPGRVFFCTAAGTSAASEPVSVAVTWSTTDLVGTFTFSNGNLTAQASVGGNIGVRATAGVQSGNKVYIEYTIVGNANASPGFIIPTGSLSSFAGSSSGGAAELAAATGAIWYSGNNSGITIGAVSVGNIICVAIDLSNLRAWFRLNNGNWNGSGTANPATNTGGLDISSLFTGIVAFPAFTTTSGTGAPGVTANFGASGFTYTVPSGFTSLNAQFSGYSAAIDGGYILDGGATFRAGCRFSQTLTLGGIGITWNPNDLFSVTLSGGNLVATTAGLSSTQIVRATSGQTSGKFYFEIALSGVGAIGGTSFFAGVAASTVPLSGVANSVHGNGTGAFWVQDSGAINIATSAAPGSPNVGSFSTGTLCFAVDMVNLRAWARLNNGNWNGSSSNNPSTNVGGVDISSIVGSSVAAMPFVNLDRAGGQQIGTANFGASAFTYTVPSGFQGGPTQTMQPQQAGYLYAYPKIARPSMTYYLDPMPVLS